MTHCAIDLWRLQAAVKDLKLAVIGSILGGWFVPSPPKAKRVTLVPATATAEAIKQKFQQRGMTFTQWAKDNGYTRQEVCRVLNGQTKAKYGKAHEIAVKLGLKPAVQ